MLRSDQVHYPCVQAHKFAGPMCSDTIRLRVQSYMACNLDNSPWQGSNERTCKFVISCGIMLQGLAPTCYDLSSVIVCRQAIAKALTAPRPYTGYVACGQNPDGHHLADTHMCIAFISQLSVGTHSIVTPSGFKQVPDSVLLVGKSR
jgi:hypothetical protein